MEKHYSGIEKSRKIFLTQKRINILAVVIVLLPALIFYYINNFNNSHIFHGDMHFYYVIFSSAIAILVGIASYFEYKNSKVEKIFYLAVGFIGVGVFYTFHALVTPNMTIVQPFEFQDSVNNISVFVLFGDLSRLWLAVMMFIPDNLFEKNHKVKKHFNGYTLIILFFLLSVLMYIALQSPERFPVFKNDDMTDTYIAILTKVATLLFLGINALKYIYSYKAKPNITILSFIIGLCFIMETAIIFMISVPWSATWWLAHNIFLGSYIVIGLGVLYSYFKKEKYEYFDVIGQINSYTKLLEEQNNKLHFMANNDSLTGLSNRSYFISATEEHIEKAKKDNSKFALMYIDLDYFKTINDKFGHQIGDDLLKNVSNIISGSIKQNDIASRIGGDEFLLLLKEVTNLEKTAQTIINRLGEPIIIKGNICNIGASIGVSVFPDNGETIDELIHNADEAMYTAKKEGRNTYKIHTKGLI